MTTLKETEFNHNWPQLPKYFKLALKNQTRGWSDKVLENNSIYMAGMLSVMEYEQVVNRHVVHWARALAANLHTDPELLRLVQDAD